MLTSISPHTGYCEVVRTLDGTRLTAVANDPDVRPWLGGVGELDLIPIIADPSNVAWQTDGGGFVCVGLSPGQYEVHTMFLPNARSGVVDVMRSALDAMFTRTDAAEIVTKVPDDNAAAARLAAAGGFTSRFRADRAWPARGGPVGVDHLSLTIEEWALASAACAAAGEWFHERLEDEKARRGSALSTHDDDATHDAMVGAAVLMLRVGNAAKAVAFYNRWARFAGYAPLALIGVSPAVIDLGDAVVEVRGDDFEVLLCR